MLQTGLARAPEIEDAQLGQALRVEGALTGAAGVGANWPTDHGRVQKALARGLLRRVGNAAAWPGWEPGSSGSMRRSERRSTAPWARTPARGCAVSVTTVPFDRPGPPAGRPRARRRGPETRSR